jgi:hypothetical protein
MAARIERERLQCGFSAASVPRQCRIGCRIGAL